MVANQTESFRLEQSSVIKSLVVAKFKQYEIYQRMCDMYGGPGLIQKMFTNGLNMGLPRQSGIKKTVCGMEAHLEVSVV